MTDEPEVEEYTDHTAMGTIERFVASLDDNVEAVSSVVIVAELVGEDGMPRLAIWRDQLTGIWKHRGMAATAEDDFAAACQEQDWEWVEVDDEED